MTAPYYSLAAVTAAAASGAPYVQLINTDSSQSIGVVEIGLVTVAATAVSLALFADTARGTANSNFAAGLSEQDPTKTDSHGLLVWGWTGNPSKGSSAYRQVDFPATAGSSLLWSWDQDAPLVVPAGGGVTIWNVGVGAGPICDVYMRWAHGQIVAPTRQVYGVGT